MFEKLREAIREYRDKARAWLESHGSKVFLLLGVLSSVALAFESGFLLGRDRQIEPMVITTPAAPCISVAAEGDRNGEGEASKTPTVQGASIAASDRLEASPSPGSVSPAKEEFREGNASALCAFVGSRNSDKYHLPNCSWAKRIKPENRVCFTSAQDAESKGYKAGCVK